MVRIKVFKIFDGGSNPPSPAVSELRSPAPQSRIKRAGTYGMVQVNFIWASGFFIPGPGGAPAGRVAGEIQTKATLRSCKDRPLERWREESTVGTRPAGTAENK